METAAKNRIFLVDDDEMYLKTLRHHLAQSDGEKNIELKTFASGEQCLQHLDQKPDIVVLDYFLSKDKNYLNGIQTLNKIKSLNSNIEVIILSSQEKLDIAVNSIKYGAYDYVIKSKNAFIRTQHLINKVLYNTRLKKELKGYEVWNIVLALAILFVLIASLAIL